MTEAQKRATLIQLAEAQRILGEWRSLLTASFHGELLLRKVAEFDFMKGFLNTCRTITEQSMEHQEDLVEIFTEQVRKDIPR